MKILCTEKIEVTKGFFFLKTLSKTITERHVVCAHYSFSPTQSVLVLFVWGWELRNSQSLAVPRWGKETQSLFIVWLERVVMFQV